MAFITISREFGSLGTTIGQDIAKSLNYTFIDKTVFEKVLERYGVLAFHENYASPHDFWERLTDGNKDVTALFNKTILEFSRVNNAVFLGRAGFVLLHEYKNVLHVMIKAPFEKRVSNIMESMHISDREAAAEMVMKNDHARISYIKSFYKANPNDAAWFDLVIDTACIPPSTAGKWIAEAAGILGGKKIDPEKSTLSIESDEIMQKVVSDILSQ